MEWGIVRGNDPFLYGEKIKAYLRKGARPLRGEMEYPNDRVGYGRLCVADSLPQTGTTEGSTLVAHWKQFRKRNEEKQMK